MLYSLVGVSIFHLHPFTTGVLRSTERSLSEIMYNIHTGNYTNELIMNNFLHNYANDLDFIDSTEQITNISNTISPNQISFNINYTNEFDFNNDFNPTTD